MGDRGGRDVLLAIAVWISARVASWTFAIALALFAYDVGGPSAVGLAITARLLPAALAGPFVTTVVDRAPRRTVLCTAALLEGLVVAVAAWLAAGTAPFALVVTLAGVQAAVGTVKRPALVALLPEVADSPTRLARATAAVATGDYGGFLVGSLVAGGVAATAGAATAFWVAAGAYTLAGLATLTLPRVTGVARDDVLVDVRTPALGGLVAIQRDPDLRLLVLLQGSRFAVQGVLDVLLVVIAFDLLGTGEAGVGLLNGAWGVGGLAGGLAVTVLFSRRRHALASSLVAAGLPVAVLGLPTGPVAALALLVVTGVGFAVSGATVLDLVQRRSAPDVLGRVLGAVGAMESAAWSAGALLAAPLLAAVGPRPAIVTTGLALPLLALVGRRRLASLEAASDVPPRTYATLRRSAVFAAMPVMALEQVAATAGTRSVPAGTVLIREGERGDELLVVERGEVVVRTAAHGELAVLGPGDHVGEIALLREVPRTATVVAATDTSVVVVERDTFLAAIASPGRSGLIARRVADARTSDTDARDTD